MGTWILIPCMIHFVGITFHHGLKIENRQLGGEPYPSMVDLVRYSILHPTISRAKYGTTLNTKFHFQRTKAGLEITLLASTLSFRRQNPQDNFLSFQEMIIGYLKTDPEANHHPCFCYRHGALWKHLENLY